MPAIYFEEKAREAIEEPVMLQHVTGCETACGILKDPFGHPHEDP